MDERSEAALDAYLEAQTALEPTILGAVTALVEGLTAGDEHAVAHGMTMLQEAKDAIGHQKPPAGLIRSHRFMQRALSLYLEAARAGMQGLKARDDSRVRYGRDRIDRGDRLVQESTQQAVAYLDAYPGGS